MQEAPKTDTLSLQVTKLTCTIFLQVLTMVDSSPVESRWKDARSPNAGMIATTSMRKRWIHNLDNNTEK